MLETDVRRLFWNQWSLLGSTMGNDAEFEAITNELRAGRLLPPEKDAINGPLMIIPKSHRYGTLAAGHDESTTSYPLWTLDSPTVTRLCAEAAAPGGVGIVAPTGRPGSVLMFHGNLVHASPPNITPYPLKIVYVTFCACSNHITKFTRAEWIAHRDFTPIAPVGDAALLEYARAHRVAAE